MRLAATCVALAVLAGLYSGAVNAQAKYLRIGVLASNGNALSLYQASGFAHLHHTLEKTLPGG